MTIFVTLQLIVTLDSICNSCDVYLSNLRLRMKQRWGVLRGAVLLQGIKKSKVSKVSKATEEKCVSSSTSTGSFPYPTEFTKPIYPSTFDKPHFPTEFEKTHYPTEFAKPHFPTEYTRPNQIQTQTQTTLSESVQADVGKEQVEFTKAASNENISETETAPKTESALARNRWGKVGHQVGNKNEGATQSVSYCPSLPAPEGPFPPPAFTYSSPAHTAKTISGPGAENGPEMATPE